MTRYRHDVAAEVKAAWQTLKALGVNSLTADPTANPKIEKSLGVNVMTAPLHLAPAKLSGFEVCPKATAGCRAACLHTAGNPAYMQNKQKARIARTQAYFKARDAFMIALWDDINKIQRKARIADMRCGVRLNATSDIPWENVAFIVGGHRFANMMQAFPNVTFYDYTKRANRRNLPRNYHLTFSLAEDNMADAYTASCNGMNVAAVFSTKKGKALPATFELRGDYLSSRTLQVIDGDEHDFRPIDPRGVIVGLRAKGDARNDKSGFVRQV